MLKFLGAFASTILVLFLIVVAVHVFSPHAFKGDNTTPSGRYGQSI